MTKRLLFALFALLFFATPAFSTCTVTHTTAGSPVELLTFTCQTDTAGSATITGVTSGAVRGWVFQAETDPGATGPTDNYDIVLNNSGGADVFNGALANRDTTNTELAWPLVGTIPVRTFVDGTLAIVVTNNSVNNATFVMKVWIMRER